MTSNIWVSPGKYTPNSCNNAINDRKLILRTSFPLPTNLSSHHNLPKKHNINLKWPISNFLPL